MEVPIITRISHREKISIWIQNNFNLEFIWNV